MSPNVDYDYIAKSFSIEIDIVTILLYLLHHPSLLNENTFTLKYPLLYSWQLHDISIQQQQK